MVSAQFAHLKKRCAELTAKYADPDIRAELAAVAKGEPIPDADIDNIVALRLIAHAEFEYYFEEIARDYIEAQRTALNAGQTMQQSALIFLYLQRRKIVPTWSPTHNLEESAAKAADLSDYKNLLTEAIGFASDAIEKNNGVKEANITLLASLSGRFAGETSGTLITELNTLGSERGAVAHKSWTYAKRANIQSPIIEKNRIEGIIKIIEEEFEI